MQSLVQLPASMQQRRPRAFSCPAPNSTYNVTRMATLGAGGPPSWLACIAAKVLSAPCAAQKASRFQSCKHKQLQVMGMESVTIASLRKQRATALCSSTNKMRCASAVGRGAAVCALPVSPLGACAPAYKQQWRRRLWGPELLTAPVPGLIMSSTNQQATAMRIQHTALTDT